MSPYTCKGCTRSVQIDQTLLTVEMEGLGFVLLSELPKVSVAANVKRTVVE